MATEAGTGRRARLLSVATVLLILLATGCAGETAERRPDVCTPKVNGEPCASARLGVEYPTALLAHCDVGWTYFGGRYWVIDPPQPGGPNQLYGDLTLVTGGRLLFRGADGRRYAFKHAPTSFTPPLCY